MIKNLSPSRASQFKTCPKQFKFANVDKLKEPTNELAQFPTPTRATLILSLLIHITLATIRFMKNTVLIEKEIKPAK